MLYCIMMLVVAGGLTLFAFVHPKPRMHFQIILAVSGAYIFLSHIASAMNNEAVPFWVSFFSKELLLEVLPSLLPYFGYQLGSYCGYRYEGRVL